MARRAISPLQGIYAPLLLEAKDICDRLGRDTYTEFLHRMRDALDLSMTLSVEHFALALRYTPRLLVLLDGVDEIKPAGLQSREQLVQTRWRFSRALHPSSWIVLASRVQERTRDHESVLSALEAQRGAWRTVMVEELSLDTASLRA